MCTFLFEVLQYIVNTLIVCAHMIFVARYTEFVELVKFREDGFLSVCMYTLENGVFKIIAVN